MTDLNDLVIVQVRPFDSPVLGVLVGRIMSTTGESSFVFTSAISAEGVLPPSVSAPRSSIPSTPLTPASQVVQPSVHSNLVGTSGDTVTRIPSIPTIPCSFPYTTQSGPVGSSTFVQGFPWNGGAHSPITFVCRSVVWEQYLLWENFSNPDFYSIYELSLFVI